MKLIDVKLVDTPKNNKLYRIRSIPIFVNVNKDVLNGGYNVQPIPHPLPYSQIIVDINIVYDKGIISIDILLILGYITSDAPKNIGIK